MYFYFNVEEILNDCQKVTDGGHWIQFDSDLAICLLLHLTCRSAMLFPCLTVYR